MKKQGHLTKAATCAILAESGDAQPLMELNEKRGQGRGVGGPRQGDGGAAKCVCPECGHSEVHERGVPCSTKECPECGVSMIGEDVDERSIHDEPLEDPAAIRRAIKRMQKTGKVTGAAKKRHRRKRALESETIPFDEFFTPAAHDEEADAIALLDTFVNEKVLTRARREKLPKKVFAGPDRSYPVHDKRHVQAAIAYAKKYWNDGGESGKKAHAAWKNIQKAAKKFDVTIHGAPGEADESTDDDLGERAINLARISKLEVPVKCHACKHSFFRKLGAKEYLSGAKEVTCPKCGSDDVWSNIASLR